MILAWLYRSNTIKHDSSIIGNEGMKFRYFMLK